MSFENFSLQRLNSLPCFKISCLLDQSISIKLCFRIYHLQTKKGKCFLYSPSPLLLPLLCNLKQLPLKFGFHLPPTPSSGSPVILFLWLSRKPLSSILQRGLLSPPWNTLLPGYQGHLTKATLDPCAIQPLAESPQVTEWSLSLFLPHGHPLHLLHWLPSTRNGAKCSRETLLRTENSHTWASLDQDSLDYSTSDVPCVWHWSGSEG